jgi:hypothetical protein
MMVIVEQLVEWRLAGETFPSATLSTTNPTWPDPGSNPGRRSRKPATHRLSYGAATRYLGPGFDGRASYPCLRNVEWGEKRNIPGEAYRLRETFEFCISEEKLLGSSELVVPAVIRIGCL